MYGVGEGNSTRVCIGKVGGNFNPARFIEIGVTLVPDEEGIGKFWGPIYIGLTHSILTWGPVEKSVIFPELS